MKQGFISIEANNFFFFQEPAVDHVYPLEIIIKIGLIFLYYNFK